MLKRKLRSMNSSSVRRARGALACLIAVGALGTGCGPSFIGTWTVDLGVGLTVFNPQLTGAPPTYGFSMADTGIPCFTRTCHIHTVDGTATSSGTDVSMDANLELTVFDLPPEPYLGTFSFDGVGVDNTSDNIADEATGTVTLLFPDLGVNVSQTLTITNP